MGNERILSAVKNWCSIEDDHDVSSAVIDEEIQGWGDEDVEEEEEKMKKRM